MADFSNYFNNVSLLITHYNRSASLERLLQAFERLEVGFGEIIVSDDGSKAEHLEPVRLLQNRFSFRLVTAAVNKGLGNNINKGQDAVTKPYTLYVQEDFVPTDLFPQKLKESLSFMEEDKELDLVRYYAYFPYPHLKPFKNGFSKMNFKLFSPGYMKFYYYSDHPHLRRSSFFEKFGRYKEGVNSDAAEYSMCLSFIRNKGKGLFYNEFSTLFLQLNSADEPSTAAFRKDWKLSGNIFIRALRAVYLQFKFLKYNWDLLTSRQVRA